MGESPTRPAIFQASPLVVVTPDISPLVFSDRQLIVPVVGCPAISHAHARVGASASGNISCSLDMVFVLGGESRPGPQLLWPLGSRRDTFHVSHARRAFSVSSSSTGKPISFANFVAPAPTIIRWSVCSITSLAIFEGVLMPRIDATEPERRLGPR